MFNIGKTQTLTVCQVDLRGTWLGEGEELVLLPRKEAPEHVKEGDRLTVFIYRNSEDQTAATSRLPKAQVGEFAKLKVRTTTKHGAFLDWGMEKDLLVPHGEQPEKMREGRSYLVKVCLDNEQRPIGTGLIDLCLEPDNSPLKAGQAVQLTIWRFTDLGAAVIIDNLYEGLLYKDGMPDNLRQGDRVPGYIRQVRSDRKVDVTLQPSGMAGIDVGKDTLLALLREHGELSVHDRSAPDEIQQATGLSKKMFKKATGGLYKAGIIEFTGNGIRFKTQEK